MKSLNYEMRGALFPEELGIERFIKIGYTAYFPDGDMECVSCTKK